MTSPYWTNPEAASFLRCSVDTLNRRRRSGEFVEGEHFKAFGAKARGRRTFLWFPWALKAHVQGDKLPPPPDVIPLASPSRKRVA